MVERDKMLDRDDCYQYAHREDGGEVLLRELIIPRNNKLYKITVTTPQYLDEIRIQNEQQTDSNLRFEIKAYTLVNILRLDHVCSELASLPFEVLESYLEEIYEEDQGDKVFRQDIVPTPGL